MRRVVLALCLSLLFDWGLTMAQETNVQSSRNYNEAVSFAEAEDFKKAIPIFKRVLKTHPTSPEVFYYLGYCYLNTSEGPDSAMIYFKKGLEYLPEADFDSELGVDMRYSLAKSYQLTLKTAPAVQEYEKLLTILPADATDFRNQINRDIETCGTLNEAIKKPVGLKAINAGAVVNSKNDDHSPLISADGTVLFFTTRRSSSYSELMPDGQYSEKIYYSLRNEKTGQWGKPLIINKLFKREGHESCVSLSADGTELYLFRNDIEGKNLYVCQFDGKTWSEPMKLDEPINTPYNETHITLSPDKATAFFTSDRPGGIGGLDIYEIRRLPNGQWGKPRNLGPEVNTPFDEETPMLHPDGKTIYFSSEGHNSIGGLDIFMTKIQEDSLLSKPVNMGYPINTPDDDFFFVPTATYNQAWYASANFKDTQGGHDLYLLEYEQTEESRLAVLTGEVSSNEEVPLDGVRVNVTEKGTDNMYGVYKPHPGTGKYVLILEYGKAYDLTFSGEEYETLVKSVDVTYDMTYAKTQKSFPLENVQLVAIKRPGSEVAVKPGQSLADGGQLPDGVTDSSDRIPFYTVQILTLTKPVASWDRAFKGLDQSLIVEYKCQNNMYRYAYGKYKGFKAAVKAKEKVLENSPYQDSFIRDVKQYDKLVVKE